MACGKYTYYLVFKPKLLDTYVRKSIINLAKLVKIFTILITILTRGNAFIVFLTQKLFVFY